MSDTLNHLIQTLTKLLEKSRDKRLLWEEMQLISQKAFALQDKIMDELDRMEATQTDIAKVQATFAAREDIWDLMRQLTDREQEIKAKTHHKETPAEREKRHRDIAAEEHKHTCHCGCGHAHHNGCCDEKHTDCKGKKSCKKSKK